MSSQYPVLDNRPIDQWKVTELKEELKRRKLTTKGLKDDLIKRLHEAIKIELEEAKENSDDSSESDSKIDSQSDDVRVAAETSKNNMDSGYDENDVVKTDDTVEVVPVGNDCVPEVETTDVSYPIVVEQESVAQETLSKTTIMVAESVGKEASLSEQGLHDNDTQNEGGDSKNLLKDEDPNFPYENVKLDTSEPSNQLSEVSPVLDETLKSDSTCTDSVSINENNKLISDDVKLELEVNPDLARPSSRNVVPNGGESHPMDVEEPHESKVSVTGKEESIHAESPDKIDIEFMGTSEKLNLDRSSGDESMEDDATESKQIDSKFSSDEVTDKGQKTVVPTVKDEGVNSVIEELARNEGDVDGEKKISIAEPPGKRKLHEAVTSGNTEPGKRQRLWNSEGLKVSEPQRTDGTTTTPRAFQPVTKRSLSGSDLTVSNEAPKERVVPPSSKPPSNSLRIDNFLRPFTLKAVQELLGRTGTVTSFWMDHIKTHCYVSYSSVEGAVETRNAVCNLQWPVNGGRLLMAEFVDPQEVKMRAEGPPPQSPATPSSTGPIFPAGPLATLPQPSPRLQVQRHPQQPPLPTALPPPPKLSNPPPVRERLPLPPPPPPPPPSEKLDAPIVTLDDLFRKTRATPRIYFLPLSEEQVAAKLKSQGKAVKL